MTEFLGFNVTKLKRVRIMNVRLAELKAGQYRELSQAEMAELESKLLSSSKTEEASLLTTAKAASAHRRSE
ncbi:MAG: 23S rRNA pseudouridine synthase F, partial [Gammaproteobacteria bacterium]|nr:23S rRNA pseudouridine synthase F [Gammaproteobacteria bacterium]